MSGPLHPSQTPVPYQPGKVRGHNRGNNMDVLNNSDDRLGVAGNAMDEDIPERVHRPFDAAPVTLRPKGASQLPTPQSPSNPSALVSSVNFSADSPIRHGNRSTTTLATQTATAEQPSLVRLERFSSSGSLITPESSPIFSRRLKSSHVASASPPSTPRGIHPRVTPDFSASTPRPYIPSTPSPRLAPRSPPSGLSSPFMEPAPYTPQKQIVRRAPVESPAHADDLFLPAASSSKSTAPPLSAPVPQRPPGGEIYRIRMQMAADQAARVQETESRRPEYLRRAKRRLSDPDVNDVPSGDQENTAPTLGVTESPVKGRRITLFQETSEESFEQSLLAGGYPSYGHTPAYGEPSTPQQPAKGLSQRAMDWIQQSTPGFRPSSPVKEQDPERLPNEEDQRKRRRLDAFRDHNPSAAHGKLFATELEGRGRVLLDRPVEEVPFLNPATPTKKRSRRKKVPVVDSPSRRKAEAVTEFTEFIRPNWLDQSFPWSLRLQEREEDAKKEEEEKLRWIERYLELESDEDDEEDQSLGLPPTDAEEPPVRRGRGKMVPLPVNPAAPPRPQVTQAKAYYPSDPADARAALLSKRSVRALAFRRRQEKEQEVACGCNGQGEDSSLVQCDDCHRWYHLACIGLSDPAELGNEEDPWYCRDCLGLLPVGSSSPIYVPTDDRPVTGPRRDPLFFQGAAVQESPPGLLWHTPRAPKTPSRSRDMTHHFSTRSSWADSSDVGPVTPSTATKGARIYRTPSAFDPLDEPFDPTATPSRGMRLTGPFTTPKATHIWPHRATMLQTPSRAGAYRKLSSTGLQFPAQFPGEYDDSPVRRTQPREAVRMPRQNIESPLASRSTAFPQVVRTGSPVARGSGRRA